MSLSDKRNFKYSKKYDETKMFFYGEDVKEFIKELKDNLETFKFIYKDKELFTELIDKLAGEKLI